MKRHYCVIANKPKYWFNIWPGQIEDYQKQFKKDFSIIVFRTKDSLDCYAIPFIALEKVLVTENLMPYQEKNLRWVGDIQNGKLTLKCPAKTTLDVQKFYNNISLVKDSMVNFDWSRAVKSASKTYKKAAVGNKKTKMIVKR
jgi:hypothetical protein